MLIIGTSGADTLLGSDAADEIKGLAGNDTLLGGGGDDALDGGLGNDVIDGGSGIDSAVFVGRRDEFTVSIQSGVVSITDTYPVFNQGTDTLTNVERLQFSDQTITLTFGGGGSGGGATGGGGSATLDLAFDDSTGPLDPYRDAISASVQAAWSQWSQHFDLASSVSIEVRVSYLPSPGVLAAAGSFSVVATGQIVDGLTLRQSGTGWELANGSDPNGSTPDGVLHIASDPAVFAFTTSPDDAVPSGKFDGLTVFAHEFGHILGINGFVSATTGGFGGSNLTTYDQYVLLDQGQLYFTGPAAFALAGGAVRLAAGDAFHLLDLADLMSPSLAPGVQEQVSLLDLAILKDTGVPIALPGATGSLPAMSGLADIFRFVSTAGGHFFAVGEGEKAALDPAVQAFEGDAFQAPLQAVQGSVPVYRFLNAATNGHLMTTDEGEKAAILANLPSFAFKEAPFQAFASEVAGTTAVFRLLNHDTGSHLFTTSVEERDAVLVHLPHYALEGIAFWAFTPETDIDTIGLAARLEADALIY